MKISQGIMLPMCLALAQGAAMAQSVTTAEADTSIVQYLERRNTGGVVNIVQPAELDKRLSRGEALGSSHGSKTLNVYRVQLYSDNRTNRAKAEAERRAHQVRAAFNDLDVYVTFTSPFWRVRVGNFRSFEDANKMLHDLKTAFPAMASEMRIVRDRANVEMLDYSNE